MIGFVLVLAMLDRSMERIVGRERGQFADVVRYLQYKREADGSCRVRADVASRGSSQLLAPVTSLTRSNDAGGRKTSRRVAEISYTCRKNQELAVIVSVSKEASGRKKGAPLALVRDRVAIVIASPCNFKPPNRAGKGAMTL